ncbi:MAG: hypothetical protein V4614_07535 [Pseudomonadota bacterium]
MNISVFASLMECGGQFHQEGLLPQAQAAFEAALLTSPGDLDATSALATMLSLQGLHHAAFRVLQDVEEAMLQSADGAANLAIAAENCKDVSRAYSAYERALQLDPNNLRALRNVALIAARLLQWKRAIACASKCVELEPEQLVHHQNLSDFLTGARRYPEALQALDQAEKLFPGYLDITVRRITVLAFSGHIEQSDKLKTQLDGDGKRHLNEFLATSLKNSANSACAATAVQLFATQAFAAMEECDWRDSSRLTDLFRQIAGDSPAGTRDSPFYALALDLDESELMRIHEGSISESVASFASLDGKSGLSSRTQAFRSNDKRIRIGFAVHHLHQLPALKQQLALCDSTRFAFHAYSFPPPAQPFVRDALQPVTAVVEMAHMTDAEAIARIRLDSLDVYMDTAPDARSYRPSVAVARVARVQLRHHNWYRTPAASPWDYTVSDSFVDPEASEAQPGSALIRMPFSCWLPVHAAEAAHMPPLSSTPERESAGLPLDKLILCVAAPPAAIDELSFSLWLEILRSLPDTILWLPACPPAAAANLARAATSHGIDEQRLLFSQPMRRDEMLARMACADIVLDTLRLNDAQVVHDALQLGVPVISYAGTSMASRMSGSILQAANLLQCVNSSPANYVAEVVRLGRHPESLSSLRQQVSQSQKAQPFDLASRMREWESAWSQMVERDHSGLPPASFDVEKRPA